MRLSLAACLSLLCFCCSACSALQLSSFSTTHGKCSASLVETIRQRVRQRQRQCPAVLSHTRTASFQRTMCAASEASIAVDEAAKSVASPEDVSGKLAGRSGAVPSAVSSSLCSDPANNVVHRSFGSISRALTRMVVTVILTLTDCWKQVAAVFAAIASFPLLMRHLSKDPIDRAALAIDRSEITLFPPEVKTYAHRPALEKALAAQFDSPPYGGYTIVYGPSGVGVNSVVEHTAAGRKGVVMVGVWTVKSCDDIVSKLVEEVTGESRRDGFWGIDELLETIKRCKKAPIILFKLHCDDRPEQVRERVYDVSSMCKVLGKNARCFIVLSEASAVTEFRDRSRERFVFVDEMTTDEAKEMLKLKLGPDSSLISDEQMDYIFKTIGTKALLLKKLSGHVLAGHSVEKFVDSLLADVRCALRCFPFQSILKALKENPEGVSTGNFVGVIEKGVQLHLAYDVMQAAKRHNVIVYNKHRYQYQLASTYLKTALKSYDIRN